jgi:hypothetical protein
MARCFLDALDPDGCDGAGGLDDRQNNFRFSAGIVFKLGN